MSDKLFLMPLDWDALLTDEKVIGMSDQAFRAYLHLLRAAWQSDVPATLPDNDSYLARVTCLGLESWKQVRPEIQDCFRVSNGRWNQKKMRMVYDEVMLRRKKQSDKGKSGAAKRWANAPAIAQALPDQCPDDGNQSQSQKESHTQNYQKETTSPPPTPEASEGQRFVLWFLELLAVGGVKPALTPAAKESWADCYEKMIRIDGRTKDEIKTVCRWAREDSFWRKNFLSPMKLREKKDGVPYFDQFTAKMADGHGTNGSAMTAEEYNRRRH